MPLFSLKLNSRHATGAQVLSDLRRIASLNKKIPLTSRRYRQLGRFSITLLTHRFGSWNNALTKARLPLAGHYRIPSENFFKELKNIWQTLGHQPTRDQFTAQKPLISAPAYTRRFGSWTAALTAFSSWTTSTPSPAHPRAHPLILQRTPRFPSLGLRHQILKRDNFKCIHCGRSPATHPNTILHIDHKIPWSKGGPTTPKNLQTLCQDCNRGKSTS
jgi:hypothetical protein